MEYQLPPLPYAYDALEPYIDAQTMEIHYTKHHQAYIDTLNKALSEHPDLKQESLVTLLSSLAKLPESIKTAVQNGGGGHFNHTLFWNYMKPKGGGQPKGQVGDAIKKKFGIFEAFKEQFNTAAKTRFGSGWAWLCLNKSGDFTVISTANQDTPLALGMKPVMGLDVWEHAYYLKYQNKRPDYINAWWNVINWEQIEENYRIIK